MRTLREWVVVAVVALASTGCASQGKYVWVDAVPPDPPTAREYVIQNGDLLEIRVLTQDAMTTKARVRSDGRIAMPLLGDVEVRGKRPSALRAELEARLKDYLVAPSVTVSVEEARPVTVSVLGEVGHPGVVTVDWNGTVAEALAAAGGLTDYASRDGIYVVRANPPMRVRFTYRAITRGEGRAPTFALHAGDVVVVE